MKFYLAARYSHEELADEAYGFVYSLINLEPCELSVYRFLRLTEQLWYVVVLGELPDPKLCYYIEMALMSEGEWTLLPQSIVQTLAKRRKEQTQHSS